MTRRPDSEVDDLLGRLRDELAVAPSIDFGRRIRAGVASRRAPSRWARRLVPALTAAAIVLAGAWWAARTRPASVTIAPRIAATPPDVPVTLAAPQTSRVGIETGPAGRTASARWESARSLDRASPGRAPVVEADALPFAAMPPTRVTLERLGEFRIPMWTVEPTRPFATVDFAAPPIATVEFRPVAFQEVILPELDVTTLSPPVNRGGWEKP